ncbi:Methyltransferase domain [Desmophyllum pertusum]|uniref:Methyltransferase domain n=1 Tax=Desmophyllum pertusum TaxID=174260 RepID=A0A9X0D9K9_9CNID|nr:Methyltransferase domain [Desmophyllum pertusum]
MATKDYAEGYTELYGEEWVKLSDETTEKELKDFYVEWSKTYDTDLNKAQAQYHRLQTKLFDAKIKEVFKDKPKDEIKIVDAGAGTGMIAAELKKLGYTNLAALDISPEMLKKAEKKNLYKKFVCAALNDKPIPEIETGEFDALICCGSLAIAHIESDSFVEMVRMVKPGGVIHFNIRPGDCEHKFSSGNPTYEDMIQKLEDAGKWEKLVYKEVVEHYARDDMPPISFMFEFKVLKN